MPVQIIRILLYIMLCLMLSSCSMGCGDQCVKYQDIAGVEIMNIDGDGKIDSVVMIVNDSIMGCKTWWGSTVVGSKTHNIRFPINTHVQLFSEGDLWKELSFKMDKNTLLRVYRGTIECGFTSAPVYFLGRVESAKKNNRFIDSFQTDDFCWSIEKMDEDFYDFERCIEWAVGGEEELCRGL
ncbi:MAG: hypothetical protein LBQ76_08800 [Candidatus Fibromonas sp.]|nr:hypothetical protein [Candidatus Fibromonas sp.]